MIQIINASKKYDDIVALEETTTKIKEGQVFGLIGTNGAGKSTMLRMIAGVMKSDTGSIMVDDMSIYDNEEAKSKIFYISDEQFFFTNALPKDMALYYKNIYPNFDMEKFEDYLNKFDLPANRKIKTFSKGMKKQLSVILGISANTKYILCDETFDGLDSLMRQGVKSIFAKEVEGRGLTPIIASHNLREIEDICEHIGMLYKGGMIVSNELDKLKLDIYRIQCVLSEGMLKNIKSTLNVLNANVRGSVVEMVIKASIEEIEEVMKEQKITFYETLPLSLEEIFIVETEEKGYDVKKLIQNME